MLKNELFIYQQYKGQSQEITVEGRPGLACSLYVFTPETDRRQEGIAGTQSSKKPPMGSVAKYGLMTCASLVLNIYS